MKDYASFMPKTNVMPVGIVDLEVCEFTIAKRDAALKIILGGLDVATIIKPFWDAAKAMRTSDEVMVDLSVVVKQAKDILMRVLGNDLTLVSCLTLDTPANRKKVAISLSKASVEEVATDEKFGYTYSPQMFDWVKENLTARQEYQVFESIFELNDFVGLVKNYVTLVVGTFQTTRARIQNPEKKTALNGAH